MDKRFIFTKLMQEKSKLKNTSVILPTLGRFLNDKGKFKLAVSIFKKCPFNSLATIEKIDFCHSLHQVNKTEKALKIIGELEKEHSNVPELALTKSMILRETDHDLEALLEITRAIELKPKKNKYLYWYTRALIHMDLGQNEEAIADYKETIKYESKETVSSTWCELAETYSRMSRTEEAIEALNEAVVREEKTIPMFYYRLGLEYQGAGKLLKAIEEMKKAHALHQYLSSFSDKGQFEYYKRARYSAAAFHNFYQFAEDHCSFLTDLGELYREVGDFDQSIHYLSEATQLNPLSDLPFIERGLTYKAVGDYQKAIADFELVKEREPSFLMCSYWIAGCYFDLKQYERALEVYNFLVEEDSEETTFLLERAYTNMELTSFKEAEKDLSAILAIDPESVDALLGRSKARKWLGKYEDALSDLMDAKVFDKELENDSHYLFDLAITLKLLDYKKEAVKEVTRALNIDSENYILYLSRAELYVELDELELALTDCNNALNFMADPSEFYWLRGLIHLKMGKVTAAVKDAEEYVTLQPFNPASYFNYAIALKEEGELEQALENFEKCLSIDSDFVSAYYQIALIHEQTLNFSEATENILKWTLLVGKEWSLDQILDFIQDTNFNYDLIDEVVAQIKDLYNEKLVN